MSEEPLTPRRTPPIWAVVGLFTLAYWATATDPQYLILLQEFLMRRFNVHETAAALPIVAFSITAIIGTLTAGLVAQRVGIGRLIFINLWGFVLCSALNGIEADLWVFDVTRAATGLFQGGLSLLFLLGIGVLVPLHRRGMAVGVLSAGAMLAALAIPLMVLVTKPPGDFWRTPFLLFGGVALIGALGLHAIRLPGKPHGDGREASPWNFLRDRRMIGLMALGGLFLASIVAMGAQFTVFAERQFDKQIHELIWQMVTMGVGAVAGALLAGPLTDRFGPRQILVWSSLAVTIFFPLVPVLVTDLSSVYVVFFFMSALSAARVPPYQALMLRLLPENARGPILGIRNSISYAGTAVGAGVGALLYQIFDTYMAVAIFAGVISAAALVLIVLLVPKHAALHMMGH